MKLAAIWKLHLDAAARETTSTFFLGGVSGLPCGHVACDLFFSNSSESNGPGSPESPGFSRLGVTRPHTPLGFVPGCNDFCLLKQTTTKLVYLWRVFMQS